MRESRLTVPSSNRAWLACCTVCLIVTSAWGQTEFRTAQEAYSAGARLYNARRFAESRAPLEAALKLSQDPQFKVKVYRALMEAYRQLPEIDPMLEAANFIFENSESSTEKSLIARSLTSFVHERGKTAEAVDLYEARLEQDARSKPALYALTEIYRRAEPKPNRRKELLEVLAQVQKQDEASLAAKFEKLAGEQPQLAGAHWKDAAAAWLRADEKVKARTAVEKAEASGPDQRSELLSHYWHKGMGDVYLELGQAKEAIPHFEEAIEKTNIDGYIKACEEQLAKARAAADL